MSETVQASASKCGIQIVRAVDLNKKLYSLQNATSIARNNFHNGINKPIKFRQEQLEFLLLMYKEQRHKMIKALQDDLGKSALETCVYEINLLKNDVKNVLYNFKSWLTPKVQKKYLRELFEQPKIYRDAYGVVFIMGAWNYPFQSCLMPLAGAIAAGNCVVIQPHAAAIHAYNFLANILNLYVSGSCVLLCNADAAMTLDVDYLFFTGPSTEAKRMHTLCAQTLIPGTYVVGSQNPVYIDESADLPLAAERIMWGKCINAGQTCIAPGYILCSREAMIGFISEIPRVIQAFYGDPKLSPDYSRIISTENFDRLISFLTGREIAYGGHYDRNSLYIEPTVLANVTPNFAMLYDEVYGPILPIIVLQNIEEVISFLRAREKPLSFYIFSKNNNIVDQLITHTSSGGVTVNDVFMHFAAPCLPFGGVGGSGFGAYHGKSTFNTFTHEKSVLKKSLNSFVHSMEKVKYPPYTDRRLYLATQLARIRIRVPSIKVNYLLTFLMGIGITYMVYYAVLNKSIT